MAFQGYRLDPREVKTMFTYIDLDNCGLVLTPLAGSNPLLPTLDTGDI